MDPDVTIELINDAIYSGDLCEAYDHIVSLDTWIQKNRMIPWNGINATHDLLRIMKRGILQCSNEGRCQCYYCAAKRVQS